MDPLLVAAIGSAALAAVLKRRKPAGAPDEVICPPPPPPVESEEWVGIARQATALVGSGGAAAAGILVPGAGMAVGGAIALGQQVVDFGLQAFDNASRSKKEQIRQRLISSCYGNPPGTVFRKYGRRKSLGFSAPLGDILFIQTGANRLPGIDSHIKINASIPVAADVKYFVTIEGPPRCCAKRISPAQAAAMGHELYSEAKARTFWNKVKARKEFRLMQRRMQIASAMQAAANNPDGAKGTGFIDQFAVVRTVPPNYSVPPKEDFPGDVSACIAGRMHTLFCADDFDAAKQTRDKFPCIWVDPGAGSC